MALLKSRDDRGLLAFLLAVAITAGSIPITVTAHATSGTAVISTDICYPLMSPDLPSRVGPASPATPAWLSLTPSAQGRVIEQTVLIASRLADAPESPPPELFL
jgi:hypothetical protein